MCALFRTDCLPGPGGGGFGARFLRLKFHKTIQSEASPAYEHWGSATSGGENPLEAIRVSFPISSRRRTAYLSQMNSLRGWFLSSYLVVGLTACPRATPEPKVSSGTPRPFVMGFSVIPPKPDIKIAVRSLEIWTKRADAAIMHLDVPWALLLAGTSPEEALRRNGVDLEHYYRSKHLVLVVTIDVTNGLGRESEAPALVAAHRSITEPAVQRLYRNYVRALVDMLHPDYLGLAAETNLVRAIAPRTVYDAVVRMANDAAADIRKKRPSSELPLYVSVQVETAWGKLGKQAVFAGIDQDMRDFPFMNVIGLSSYPYLGGFKDPDQIPLDYYTRLKGSRSLPVMVVEGGWPSASMRGVFSSSPEMQARYIARQSDLLDAAKAIGVFQLSFTDLDLGSFPKPLPAILPLFATLGLVDSDLSPKSALAVWDKVYARPLRR